MIEEKEMERSKVLEDFDIMYTDPEPIFDDITKIAAQICNVPIALITFLDDKKQFFKSRYGINIQETPIEHSFCAVAIASGADTFCVSDAKSDSRFSSNPFVTGEPHIASYNAVILKSEKGIPFGTICVISDKEGTLNDAQFDALQALSNQVIKMLELRRANILLNNYQKKLEDYNKRIEEFASMAAHDLKSPLRGVKSFIELIQKRHKSHWDDKDSMYFDFVQQGVDKMQNLIEALFEYSKSDLKDLKLVSVDMESLIKELFKSNKQTLNQPEARLELTDITNIKTYPIVVNVIFDNLINNALKYHKAETTPVIKISATEDKHWHTYLIKDNGIGIASAHYDLIFEPFKRLHNDNVYKGSGLGLATCKRIIDNIGGKISVSSDIKDGSTFKIMLPK